MRFTKKCYVCVPFFLFLFLISTSVVLGVDIRVDEKSGSTLRLKLSFFSEESIFGTRQGFTLNNADPIHLPAGNFWSIGPSAADNSWKSVAWGGPLGNEKFVAVASTGTGNQVMTSPDGVTWTSQTSAANNFWNSVTWGGPAGQEQFVAVAYSGSGNRVMTSPDGINWTTRNSAADNSWNSVTWGGPAGNELFVAVAYNNTSNQVMTSPDGITWTARTSAANNEWRSVTWGGPAGNEKFVAVATSGTGNRVMTSSDGLFWTLQTSAADSDWMSVTWGGPTGHEKFVAVGVSGSGNRVMTSPDGVSWTLQSSPSSSLKSVTWGGHSGEGLFIAVSNDGKVFSSPDAITWTEQQAAAPNTWNSVVWGGVAGQEKFVTVGSSGSGNRVMWSSATKFSIHAGNNQTAALGTALSTPPSVIIQDASNNPISGLAVSFSVGSGGGSVSSASATTNASGIASVTWTLGTTLGSNTLAANVSGLTGSPLTFSATATVGPPASVTKIGTDGISALVTTAAQPPPAVRVEDAYGNPIAGANVSFDVSAGDGRVGPAVIANLSTSYSTGGSSFNKGNKKAYIFTTGPSSSTVRSATLLLNQYGSVREGHLRLSLNSVQNNVIGAALASVAAKVDLTVSGKWALLTFDAPVILQSRTSYALVVEELADQASFVWANGSGTPNTPSSFDGGRYDQSLGFDGSVWSAPNSDRNIFVLAAEGNDANSITIPTSSTGLAALGSWKMGSSPGDRAVTASHAVGSQLFTATGISGSLTQVAGNNQSAIAASPVATSPSVLVRLLC